MADIQKRIVEIISTHWNSTGTVLLASALGSILSKEFDLRTELHRLKLVDFVSEHLANKIRVIYSDDQPPRAAFLPHAAALPDSSLGIKALFETLKAASAPSYHTSVWGAFISPLQDGKRRYLSTEPPIKMVDIAEGQPAPEHSFEVAKELIASTGDSLRSDIVYSNIIKWATHAQIPLEKLTRRRDGPTKTEMSLLDHLLSVLSENELASVKIPLRVVKKLRDTPVR